MQTLRQFFDVRGYLEIQTRALRPSTATDPYVESFKSQWLFGSETLYLQPSPEFAHKIFLAEHFIPIYEVARVFRNEEHGTLHRSEFSLVEWYKPYADYRALMSETFELVLAIAQNLGKERLEYKGCSVSLNKGYEILRFRDAFERYTGFNPFALSDSELIEAANNIDCKVNPQWSRNDILNCILIDKIEEKLGFDRPCYLCDYPASMASLARTKRDEDGFEFAERFELYALGVELCNGYSELTDAKEQRRRFELDNIERRNLGYPTLPIDNELLSALPKLGALAGNALGFERLLMLLLSCDDIADLYLDY